MPRYYFHLEDGGDAIKDSEGVEADAPERAVGEALMAVQEMRGNGELANIDTAWVLVVRDDEDNELRRIPI